MSEKNRHGKREAVSDRPSLRDYWNQHRAWVAGLNRSQKIRYRALQVAVVISIIIIAVFLFLRSWVKLPDVPVLPGGTGDSSQQTGELGWDGDLPEVASSGRKDGYYTFLVAGQDVISGGTDTMILISYDTKNKEIHAVSLLRDTMINTSSSSKRLNSVYARNRGSSDLPEQERVENGMTALKQEVSKLTGIYPDFYVLVQWEAIGELVDAIGGVHFEVPFDMDYDDPAQDLHIHQEAGYRLLDGDDAMQVIRFRKGGGISLGDSGRTEIQRDFLVAVLKECLQPDILLKLPELARIFTENVDTDLTVGNILAFAQLAVGMDPDEDVTIVSMPWTGVWYNGASMVVAQEDELLEILNDGINPYVADIQSSDLQLMYKKSDGSFGVTNATLLDSRVGQVHVSTSEEPEETEEPATEEPVTEEPGTGTEGEDPVLPGTDDPSQGGTGTQDPSQGGTGDAEEPTQGTGDSSGGSQSGSGEDPVLPGTGDSSQSGGSGWVDPVLPGDSSDGTTISSGTPSDGVSSTPQGGGLVAIDPDDIFPSVDGTAPSQDIQ